jgi:hypothetical protein
VLLEPIVDAIERHVLAGQAIFGDDTPAQMLARGAGKTATARLWVYGRDERLGTAMRHPPAGIGSRRIERVSTRRIT